ncbi:MAG: hypothetical protein AB1711_10815 [Thermodesulfobacteriota bacterium]
MFSFLFLVVLAVILFISILKNEQGLLAFLFIAPFYTILRESSDGSIIFYLWPYVVMSAIMLSIMIRYSVTKQDWSPRKKYLVFGGGGIVFIAAEIWVAIRGGLLKALWHSDKHAFLGQLTPGNLAVGLLPIVFVLVAFLVIYFRTMISREKSVSKTDILVAGFFWYGVFSIFYTRLLGGGIVNALDGFRYYYVMSLVYFLCRYLIEPRRHLKIITNGFAAVFVLAALFTLFESYCMNCLKIAIENLPWSGLLFSELGHMPYGEQGKAFVSGGYTPMGLIRMTHLSGLFLLFGFCLYLPLALTQSFEQNKKKYFGLWALVGLLPIGFIFTSRTILISYLIGVLMTVILTKQFSKGTLVKVILVVVLLPLLYSYYLLPGITYDLKSELGFITTKESYGSNALINMTRMMRKDLVYCIAPSSTDHPKPQVSRDSPPSTIFNVIFGTGYSATDWVKRHGNKEDSSYTIQDASDSYYLKVMKQFGVTGLLILLGIGTLLVLDSISLLRSSIKDTDRNVFIGILVMLIVVFISTIHLGPLFKTGLNTVIFMYMSLLTSGSRDPQYNIRLPRNPAVLVSNSPTRLKNFFRFLRSI